MKVFVKHLDGTNLMPCSKRKARVLLRDKKAKIVQYEPFTIQMTIPTGKAVQPITIGIDTGSKFVGVAITTEKEIIAKGTIELRQDVSENISARRIFRRGRRTRNKRYRQAKFLNRTRKDGWLPPSIQSRVDNIINWIEKFRAILPNSKIICEVGKFDVQKIENPDIQGEEYQQGNTYKFWNDRYYIFTRDNYTCQICKGKSKDKRLRTHHIIHKSNGGSDRVDNLVTVCNTCHELFHQGKINHKFSKPKKYKETAFMNILRIQIMKRLKCEITYGNITEVKRREVRLSKSHYNDAIAVTGITDIKKDCKPFYIRQFRIKKRSLHESIPRKGRKEPNTTAKRNSKNTKFQDGFYLNDRVEVYGKKGFVCGFANGGIYVKDYQGNYITTEGKTYKQVSKNNVKLIKHTRGWQFITPLIEVGDFLPVYG